MNRKSLPFGARDLLAPGLLLAAAVWAFSGVLFSAHARIVSRAGEDLTQMFAPWRDFGFSQLRQGNLALWNPHIFSGMPFFGNFMSALLYPLDWTYLALPLAAAINLEAVVHVFLAGLFTYAWCRVRGASRWGSFLAGVMFMFSGPFYLHVYGGHPPVLCAMAWAPAMFWAIEGWLRDATPGWCLFGAFAAAMQILAGYPQVVYYTAIAAALYAGLRLLGSPRRGRFVAGLAAMAFGAAALAAVQWLAGCAAARESERGLGIPLGVARSFSFPPENLLTLLTPGLFGDMTRLPYFGRWRLWEGCLFLSLGGLILVPQSLRGTSGKQARLVLFLIVALLLLSFGDYTPLFRVLYAWLPGFDLFRGTAKFSALAALFLCALAATGFDSLLEYGPACGTLVCAAIVAALLAAFGGWQLSYARGPLSALGADPLFQGLLAADDHLFSLAPENAPFFISKAAAFASGQLFLAAGVSALACLLLWASSRSRRFAYGMILLAALEMLVFSRRFFTTADLAVPRVEVPYSASGPEESRVLHTGSPFPDIAMSLGQYDVWGYGPLMPRRYSELTNALPAGASKIPPAIAAMLRLRFIVKDDEDRVITLPPPLARVQLINDWEVRQGSAAVIAALLEPDFDPSKKLILEAEPVPSPQKAEKEAGTASVSASSTDWLDITAETPVPALLLITDNYSEGWRARAYPDSSQTAYRILPADYVLRAIPLAAGRHHLRVEYSPAAFRVGAWISLAAWPCFLTLTGIQLARKRTLPT